MMRSLAWMKYGIFQHPPASYFEWNFLQTGRTLWTAVNLCLTNLVGRLTIVPELGLVSDDQPKERWHFSPGFLVFHHSPTD